MKEIKEIGDERKVSPRLFTCGVYTGRGGR